MTDEDAWKNKFCGQDAPFCEAQPVSGAGPQRGDFLAAGPVPGQPERQHDPRSEQNVYVRTQRADFRPLRDRHQPAAGPAGGAGAGRSLAGNPHRSGRTDGAD